MEIITSLENEKVKYWTKLNHQGKDEEFFMVEGEHLVLEAIKNNVCKEVIMEKDKLFPTDVPKNYVDERILRKITALSTAPDIMAVVCKKEALEIGDRVLIIDGVQDPGNLGTMIRNAVAFDYDTVLLGQNTVSIYNPKTIRATEGMLFNINIKNVDLLAEIPLLKELDYQIYGTKVTNGTSARDVRLTTKHAIVMGNEGSGISEEIAELCDEFLYIRMSEKCESLNVAVACGILMYMLTSRYGG